MEIYAYLRNRNLQFAKWKCANDLQNRNLQFAICLGFELHTKIFCGNVT